MVRSDWFDLNRASYYYCITKTVRGGFLRGTDSNGTSRDHRADWIRERLAYLAKQFAVDLCAYAIEEHEVHFAIHVDSARANAWSAAQVREKYGAVYPLALEKHDQLAAKARRDELSQWRLRLQDLSWFMRAFRERIGRQANAEEDQHGHFWSGKFISYPILDEVGLLVAMVRINVLPLSKDSAKTLRGAKFTSVRRRLRAGAAKVPAGLAAFKGQRTSSGFKLPFGYTDYMELAKWTARSLGEEVATDAPLLRGHGIDAEGWLSVHRDALRVAIFGTVASIEKLCEQRGRKQAHGIRVARMLDRN